jgi:DNA-binding beta-propeller fold protein YncE
LQFHPRSWQFALILLYFARGLSAQTSATFGEVIPLGGTPSDIVLDEGRQRLYLVNSPANRVDVYDYAGKAVIGSLYVGQAPLSAAISMDSAFLYVANHDSSSLSVISLGGTGLGAIIATVPLPAKPQGVEVGADGRVLICTDGSGTASTANTLLLYDSLQAAASQVLPVPFPPPPPTPPALQPVVLRATTQFNGKLQRTPDGKYIIGVSSTTNNTQTVVYQYETASGTVLQSRIVTGQSSTLSMSPDGASFMAGFTLFDMATLNVLGQQNTANAPFPFPSAIAGGAPANFSTTFNVGGSVFSPDGKTLYSAFNTAALTTPPPAPQAATLLISDPRTLGISLGINLPESILSKMVVTADGNDVWALSSSGVTHLPLGTLYSYPILMPESTTVLLAQDDCNQGVAQTKLNINNIGGGKLTFAVPQTISGGSAALIVTASSGVAPASVTFTMDPGRSGVIRTPGTNLYTGGGSSNLGNAVNMQLVSPNAINVPPTIRVYMNYRDSSMRGLIYPVPTVPNSTATAYEGLQDIVLDEPRHRIYITNSGYNRIEVFDTQKLSFQTPITVGQLPHQMAMGLDGSTLYVANTGSETVVTLDLDAQQVTGAIQFPPIPRAGNAAVTSVRGMAAGLSGLQIIRSDGNLWRVVGNEAVPRTATSVTGIGSTGAQTPIAGPAQTLLGAGDGTYGILLAGNGRAYLYDGLADTYTTSATLIPTGTPIIGYYGPLGVAATGSFLLANGLVLNQALTAIGGAATPGTVTVTPPAAPGQFPTVGVSSTGLRNIAAGAPIDQRYFVRMSTPVRTNLTATTSDDAHTILEAVDTQAGSTATAARIPENPVLSEFGTTRTAMPARQVVVDSQGTVYALTVSGLSVIPLTPATSATQPQIAASGGIINSGDGTGNFQPGSFITINGASLASNATASTLPPPTVLGGSCVLVDNLAIPLLQTSPTQISAQLPASLRPGASVLQVRSLNMAQQSARVVVTIQKP